MAQLLFGAGVGQCQIHFEFSYKSHSKKDQEFKY
jgi:hypothetical protein